MRRPLWLLILAAGLLVTAGAGRAASQTVIVRNAVPASSVELLLNGTSLVTMTVGPDGMATLPAAIGTLNKTQADVRISVDACGALRRILIDENGRPAPSPQGACVRRPIPDIFVVQQITTIVLDVGGDSPLAFIRQGPAPPEWLGGTAARAKRVWTVAPKGLVVSGGGAMASYAKLLSTLCGDAPTCSDIAPNFATSATVAFWFTKLFAAEVGYVKPPKMDVSGSGTTGATYRFTSAFDADIVTIGGRAGGQTGPVKITGFGGTAYQASTLTTTQTVDATATARGGTQSFGFKTQGWGWFAGGGLETWVNRWVALYAEGGFISLRGSNPANKGEGSLDDQITYFMGGVRVHVGR